MCWEATSGVKSGVSCHSSSVLLRTRVALESKSHPQLDTCLAATVSAATHHSKMHHSLSPLHGCMKTTPVHQLLESGDANYWNRHEEHVYQKPVRDVNELKQHLIETWSTTSRASLIKRLISGQIVLMSVSKPKKINTEQFAMMCFSVTVMTFKACVTAVMNKLTHVSFHKVGWEQPSGEMGNVLQFHCKLTSVCVCPKRSKYNVVWQRYCQNKKGAIFLSHSVE